MDEDSRTLLAGMALQGILANPSRDELSPEAAAKMAVKYADALIEKLETIQEARSE